MEVDRGARRAAQPPRKMHALQTLQLCASMCPAAQLPMPLACLLNLAQGLTDVLPCLQQVR